MTKNDIDRAIGRLRKLNRQKAGEQAGTYAQRLLPSAAEHSADLPAILILSAALYCAAAKPMSENYGAENLRGIVYERYRLVLRGAGREEVFKARIDYPDELKKHLQVLSQLPYSIVASGFELVLNALNSIIVN